MHVVHSASSKPPTYQVYRTGKQADYSSEEEEEAKEAAQAAEITLPRGLLEFEGRQLVLKFERLLQ